MRRFLLATVAALTATAGVAASQAAMAQTAAPGTVTVRLNGRVNWYAGVESSSLDSNYAAGSGEGTKTSTGNFFGYLRLFPGFDGVAANGLHYGAAAEIRMNGGTSAGAETLFVHQAYGYLGLPELGQVSFGQENGPVVLFETGTFEGFNDGAWWGDIPAMIPNAAEVVYPFVDNEGLSQSTNKLVYLSPTIGGFQFGLGFEPNHVAEGSGNAITSRDGLDFTGQGSTDTVQPKNIIDVGGQFTKTFGPVGVQIGLDYMHGAQTSYTGGAQTYVTPTSFHDLNMLSGGATVSFAGVTVGGNTVYGNYNQTTGYNFQLEPQGGQKAIGWLVGAQYTMGPMVVGGSWFNFNTTGDLPNGSDGTAPITAAGLTTGQQVNNGLALGGTYTLVPGVNLFVDYLYGWRQQGGYSFSSGEASAQNNRVQSQLFGVGTQIQW